MLDIVVYGSKNEDIDSDVVTINNLLVDDDIDYDIHRFTDSCLELDEIVNNDKLLKIYILDIEALDNTDLKVINLIRQNDPFGIIIFISSHSEYLDYVLENKLMVLDFISKEAFYEKRLMDDIEIAIKKLFSLRAFVFCYNRVVYNVPYTQINYIEKEPLTKRCIIHTTADNFYIVSSLDKLYMMLGKSFYRVHQSCIINMYNVSCVNLTSNTITFKNDDMINMLSNKFKKEFKKYVDKIPFY